MNDKLTVATREALQDAVQQASAATNPQIEPAHLLNALLGQSEGVAVVHGSAFGLGNMSGERRPVAALDLVGHSLPCPLWHRGSR